MLDQPAKDPYLVTLSFDEEGRRTYDLCGPGPFFLTTGGGVSSDLARARRFNTKAQAEAKAKDMLGFVQVSGARSVRLSEAFA